MTTELPDDDVTKAAVEMVGRTGATDLEVGWLEGHPPPVSEHAEDRPDREVAVGNAWRDGVVASRLAELAGEAANPTELALVPNTVAVAQAYAAAARAWAAIAALYPTPSHSRRR